MDPELGLGEPVREVFDRGNACRPTLVETGVKFRRPEWDIEMPEVLVAYWAGWNEPDVTRIGDHFAAAVTDDIEWNDPRDSLVGLDALVELASELRASKPRYQFEVVSKIDHQHGRLRYRWNMVSRGRVMMEGLDIATLDGVTGKICRVDGFFGDPTPLQPNANSPDA